MPNQSHIEEAYTVTAFAGKCCPGKPFGSVINRVVYRSKVGMEIAVRRFMNLMWQGQICRIQVDAHHKIWRSTIAYPGPVEVMDGGQH